MVQASGPQMPVPNWPIRPVMPPSFLNGAVKGMNSIFGLPMDTTYRLLGFLQVRTLCRLRIVCSSCSIMVTPMGKSVIANFCYTADDLESTVYSKRGRRTPQPEEAKNRLMRFLTQPEHGPIFRRLDLRFVPVHILQRTDLHYAFKHMTRLTHVVYPTCGWPERSLLFKFLTAIPPSVTKEAADGGFLGQAR